MTRNEFEALEAEVEHCDRLGEVTDDLDGDGLETPEFEAYSCAVDALHAHLKRIPLFKKMLETGIILLP